MLTLLTQTVNAQEYETEYFAYENDQSAEAFAQSSYNSHWSAYVPIALMVGAIIWFAVADNSASGYDSSDSKNGIGSIARRGRSHSRYSHSSRSRPICSYH